MDRREAVNLMKHYVSDERYVKHMIAVEAVMKGLARYLGEDEALWGLTGLLHDIDYTIVKGDLSRHGLESSKILEGVLPQEALEAIRAHNYEHTGVPPDNKLSKALIAADAISGLIVAVALVMPNKRLDEVKVSSVVSKFKSKDFARGVDRSRILFCEKLSLKLEEFIDISLQSMKSIARELGL
ncbi:MAG: HD domain-containing protein [Candidatus Bathyarchaeota archaeon]|nr:HD domain-containing protein [Candidatus Bathyarchaeota archaeon]MCX8161531.1 HD domain-containing protein [Candidatus Bathyarchaeota archaeon]